MKKLATLLFIALYLSVMLLPGLAESKGTRTDLQQEADNQLQKEISGPKGTVLFGPLFPADINHNLSAANCTYTF